MKRSLIFSTRLLSGTDLSMEKNNSFARKNLKPLRAAVAAVVLTFYGSICEAKSVEPPAPFGAVPTARQLKWQKMEFCGFLHFGMKTFTQKKRNYGNESPELFNPVDLDTRQWAGLAKECGMKGLIITAKHHDGFCLWPSKYTDYSVKSSPWKNGKGDVVGELAESCKEFDIKFGFYLSPWDRNRSEYGSPEYIDYYCKQTEELLTNYGDVFEVWHDGNHRPIECYYGGAREVRLIDRKTYYQWPRIHALVRKLQPEAVMFSDAGPDVRWVGNEKGTGSETCWAPINPEGIFPGIFDPERLSKGTPNGRVWRPAEVDVSIRKHWHFVEGASPKPLKHLLDIYYSSIGNGANLLLNLTPNKRGLIPEEDAKRLCEFSAAIAATFKTDVAANKAASATNVRGGSNEFGASNVTDGDRNTYWAADDGVTKASVTIDLEKKTTFNRIRLQEQVELGQRISEFSVEAYINGEWQKVTNGTTIGIRKILRFPDVTAERVRVNINKSLACPTLSTVELYQASKKTLVSAE